MAMDNAVWRSKFEHAGKLLASLAGDEKMKYDTSNDEEFTSVWNGKYGRR